MKRLVLIMFMLVIAMTTVMFMTACGGDSETSGGDSGGAAVTDVASTKTMACFNEFVSGGAYTMEMKAEYQGVTTTMTSAVKDGMLYSKSEMDGMTSIMIMKDDVQYMLDPSTKTCLKMSVLKENAVEMFAEEAANYETAVNTGTEEIDGKTYDYEEFDVEGTSVKYCFDGNDLKYILTSMEGEEYIVEVLSMKSGADKALFEVPDDYNVMEM